MKIADLFETRVEEKIEPVIKVPAAGRGYTAGPPS
jgi:hypothetical protein